MGIDSSWRTDVILAVAKGLRNRPSGKVLFRNSLKPGDIDSIIRAESWESEFARLCYISYLLLLRLPSEAIPLTRALPPDRLLAPGATSSLNVIGLQEFQGEQRLVIKLPKRKNQRPLSP